MVHIVDYTMLMVTCSECCVPLGLNFEVVADTAA